jgi:hypothetical protein
MASWDFVYIQLDEAHQRPFIACRMPARLLVLDTASGKTVASPEIVGDTDDLFYDTARSRVYIIGGEGFIDVLHQKDPDHYERIARYPVPTSTRTGLFVPTGEECWLPYHTGASKRPRSWSSRRNKKELALAAA